MTHNSLMCRHPSAQLPGGSMDASWTLPNAHALTHACGVTALSVAHGGQLFASGGQGGEVRKFGDICDG